VAEVARVPCICTLLAVMELKTRLGSGLPIIGADTFTKKLGGVERVEQILRSEDFLQRFCENDDRGERAQPNDHPRDAGVGCGWAVRASRRGGDPASGRAVQQRPVADDHSMMCQNALPYDEWLGYRLVCALGSHLIGDSAPMLDLANRTR
jgi:hypothetical protein